MLINRAILYIMILARVVFYSGGMLLFLSALNVVPVMLENIVMKRSVFAETLDPIVSSLKLWGLFVGVMVIVCSVIFWSPIGRSNDTP
ncbi:hypothetical protein IP78_08245 [Brevundimonas sp. AAP58]|nr:hypothetical protein IP78_08245 [Brevundimonas sp. AAP58]